ncbi:MAG: glycosyltransferase [Thermoprotei archaeon]
MKLHVGACGIGYGHVGRDLPTALYLGSVGWDVYFTTYGDAVHFARASGFRTYAEPSVGYVTKGGEVTMKGTILSLFRQLNSFFTQLADEYRIIRKEKPDVVLSDSRLSTVLAAKLAGKRIVLLIHELKVLTPIRDPRFKRFVDAIAYRVLSTFWSFSDKVVISDFPPPLTIAEENVVLWWPLRKRDKLVYAGPCGRVTACRKSDHGVVYLRVSGIESERVILNDLYYKTGVLLARDGVRAIMSRGNARGNFASSEFDGKLLVYDWIRDYGSMEINSLVSVAGQTSMAEFVDLGVPFILTPPISHTEHWGIAKSLEKKGIALVLPLRGLTPEQLRDAVEQALADEALRKRAQEYASKAKSYPGDQVLISVITSLAAQHTA